MEDNETMRTASERPLQDPQEKVPSQETSFRIISNTNDSKQQRLLLDLKCLFARQLPRMPKNYFVRILFDKYHESMVLMKQEVIGGTCFRVFSEDGFAEIVFLAITATEQVQGYGTKLIAGLKSEMQRRKIEYLVTYADNTAVGYFRKQGFSVMPQARLKIYKGIIKDYEFSTLMECHVHPKLDYINEKKIIRKQKAYLVSCAKSLLLNNVRYDCRQLQNLIPYLRTTQRSAQTFQRNPELIPGVIQSGWSWEFHDANKVQMGFLQYTNELIQTLRKHNSIWPFVDIPVHDQSRRDISLAQILKQSIRGQFGNDIQRLEEALHEMVFKGKSIFLENSQEYRCAQQIEIWLTTRFMSQSDQSEKESKQSPSKKLRRH